MKGLLLAGAATLACALAVTVLFRAVPVTRRAAAMTRLFLATLSLHLLAFGATPPDLGFLPSWLVEPRPLVELAFSATVAAALFFGGVLQLYNLADRGFSLRILIDIEESPARALSPAEVIHAYGGGRGMEFMLDKRLGGLVEEGLVIIDDGAVCVSRKGERAGRLFGALRRLLRLDPTP